MVNNKAEVQWSRREGHRMEEVSMKCVDLRFCKSMSCNEQLELLGKSM